MAFSSRGTWLFGLGIAGLAYLAAPTLGQQPKTDARARAASSNASNGRRAPGPVNPPVVGSIDLENVLKNYKKVKAVNTELSEAVKVRRADLMKIESEAKNEYEMLQKFTPGSADYKKHEDRLTELKAKMDAGQEQAQREFTLRQAEMMATIYKEIQTMVARVAQWRHINYVVRISNTPPSGTDPNSVLAAMHETVLYADPQNDITNDVVGYLNHFYEMTLVPSGAPGAGAAQGQPAAAQPGAK